MSSTRELFVCDYPIYSIGRLGADGTEFYVAGGGGRAKTGIPNSLDVHRLVCCDGGGDCVSDAVVHHDMGTGVIMNCATHPKKTYQLAVGVGGECLSLEISRRQESFSPKKTSKVKRRKKSKSDEEDSGEAAGGEVSHMVVEEKVRVPTDFSSESHQKVVSFTCDGGKLVTGGSDGIVRVWQFPSLKKLCELKGHEHEVESLSSHPSKQQVVSMCRGGRAVVWDLTNQDQEHSFTWSPGQRHKTPSDAKPTYRFRASCFSLQVEDSEDSHTSLYTLAIPMDNQPKQKKKSYLVKWDAVGAWIVDEEVATGTELLSALAIDGSGRYVGVGTINGGILIYSSDLKLLSRVPAVHSVFVTGLLFLPLPTKQRASSSMSSSSKQAPKPEKQVLISVSADRTCSATLVRQKSGKFTFLFLFIFILVLFCLIALATKHYQLW